MLKREEYMQSVKRPYNPLSLSIIFTGYTNKDYFNPFLDKEYCLRDLVVIDGKWNYSIKELETAGRLAFNFWSNPINLKKAIKLFSKQEKSIINSAKSNFEDFSRAIEEYAGPSIILVWRCDKPVADKMRFLLSEKLDEKEVEELMNLLNIPLQDNYYKAEEYALVKCKTDKEIEKHVKNYEWLVSRYGSEEPYTVKQAKEKLSKISKIEFLEKYNEEKNKVKEAILKAKAILGKEDAHFVDFMQFIVYYRTQRSDLINRALYIYIPKLKELAKEKGLTYEQIIHCTKDEIQNKLPSISIIKERISGFATMIDNEEIKCVSGKEYEKLKEFFKEDFSGINNLSGQIACKGYIKGKAKVINSKQDYSKIKQGDILVTSMTTPDMVPIMKLASAFITDEGGITCHAAIIARELKKPCIIGTKIATQVLKDNQLVEIDANKGIIKILE
jgi:phosphoenolpyruvate synthase/pyruvate phosphate dikinase